MNGAPYTWTSVATTDEYACGVTTIGKALCWGMKRGTLKNYKNATLTVPVLPWNTKWIDVDVSRSLYSCGLTDKKDIRCWGEAALTQELTVPAGQVWTAVAVGGNHSCGITSNASIVCWGDNKYGQLDVSKLPPFSRKWVSISAGVWYSCAVSDVGAVSCWGSNYYGQSDAPSSPPPPCKVNVDCTTSYCKAGKCAVKLPPGGACSINADCTTSYCKSGKCAVKVL